MRLIDAEELERVAVTVDGRLVVYLTDIHNAQTIEVDKLFLIMARQNGKLATMVNALRPHGTWILHKDYNERKYGCDQCGNLNNIPSNYCPNCGADMRGKE